MISGMIAWLLGLVTGMITVLLFIITFHVTFVHRYYEVPLGTAFRVILRRIGHLFVYVPENDRED